MKIPITKPFFDETDIEYLVKPLETGWVVQGRYVSEFERMFTEFTGARFARATSNCTTALHLALESIGIGSGDRVVVPSFTYVATANAVEYTGAEVVFCDIDLQSFNVDVNELEQLLGKDAKKNIKAVIPVNLFGLCSDLPRVCDLAEKYGIYVIEDSACGFGGYIGDKHSGTFGKAGCFSFHPRKSITTGEGGMIITDDEQLASAVSSLRDHGASKTDHLRHEEGGSLLPEFNVLGYNYRMTDFQGAIGVSQMMKKNRILEGRRGIAAKYNERLKTMNSLILPTAPGNYIHGYQSYVCLFTGGEDLSDLTKERVDLLNVNRNKAMIELERRGIATRQGTHSVHTLGYYRKKYRLREEDFIRSYAADRLTIALPLYAGMSSDEFEYVVDNITEVLG